MVRIGVVLASPTEIPAAVLAALTDELRDLDAETIVVGRERRRGFAAAVNAGFAASTADLVIALDIAALAARGSIRTLAGVLADEGVGLAGARIVDRAGTLVDCGHRLAPARLTLRGFLAVPRSAELAPAATLLQADCDLVHPACIATPRALFAALGGLDPQLDAERSIADYALRVRERRLRVVYQPAAAVVPNAEAWPHPPADAAERRFADRWRERIALRPNLYAGGSQPVTREHVLGGALRRVRVPLPALTVIVHGTAPRDPQAFAGTLVAGRIHPQRAIWCAGGSAPSGMESVADPVAAARAATERRGDGYVVFVRTDTLLTPNWLDALVDGVEFSLWTMAATVAEATDARCTIVAPRLWPQHLRIEPGRPLDDALADWVARGERLGREVRRIAHSEIVVGPSGTAPPAAVAEPAPHAAAALASIVMLSWNAPSYTEMAVASIHAHTRTPYEIIVVDNGSDAETRARLAVLPGVRIIANEVNAGFAYGCNQGIAAARGSHVILLNNDVIVTDGWLEALLDVQARHPAVAISAPRTNRINGSQQVDVSYANLLGLRFFAAERAERMRGRWYREDRVIGFCMCIARELIDEIGGLDARYGIGNFEDDDFCLRARAAGYELAVCEDAFIHHFGGASFTANNVDYDAQITRSFAILRERWGFPANPPGVYTYNQYRVIARGFDRASDYVVLPPAGEPLRRAGSTR